MNDRRRINGPSGATHSPIYASALTSNNHKRPRRTREASEVRKIFLQTGLTPSASGSAYLELQPTPSTTTTTPTSLIKHTSSPKIIVTIHGPRPLPRSAPFSPNLVLTTYVKFVPFASRQRRGYVRDNAERDLGAHLEAALRGVIVGDRWPKSGIEVCVTVLEAEEDGWWGDGVGGAVGEDAAVGGWGMMTVLAGCITTSSAALVEAGIDCVDMVTGGVAAVVPAAADDMKNGAVTVREQDTQIVLDPCPAEHHTILSACVVGYLASRDELVEVWMRGDTGAAETEKLIDRAVEAAAGPKRVLQAVLRENVKARMPAANDPAVVPMKNTDKAPKGKAREVVMTG